MKKQNGLYHYKECGLNNVYLAGGVEHYDTPYGEGVMIKNVEALHRAIAKCIVEDNSALDGDELRFLRKEMDMSQNGLGEYLGVSEQTVANYEKGKTTIPKTVDMSVRALYLESIDKTSPVKKMLKRIAAIDDQRRDDAVRARFTRGKWSTNCHAA